MPRRRKIEQLPEDTRAWLRAELARRGFGDIVAVTAELNAQLAEMGLPISVGKSAVGEESQRVRRAQEAVRATTEAARLIAETAPDDGDHRSAAAMALVQSEVFELLLKIRESEQVVDPAIRLAVMNEAALGLSRLSRARVNQGRWAIDVAERAKAAADKVGRLVAQRGMDADTAAQIRASILGITQRAGQPAGAPAPAPAAAGSVAQGESS
jgi:hypothetical protein